MPIVTDTIVFKTIGSPELELNVYWREHSRGAPVPIYFHGNGSPLQGARWDIPQHMYDGISKWKYTLVSADYRLAPQVGIQEIFEDVEDCIKFVRDPQGLAASLPANTMDSMRLAVAGSGGGGYLALLAGLHVDPKPLVVLAISPISDPLGSFFTTSRPWVHWDDIEGADMPVRIAESLLAASLNPNGEAVAYHVDDNLAGSDPWRHLLYKYALHRGNLAELLHLGSAPNAQTDPANDKWRVAKQLATSGVPATYIFHGTADDQVGVGQSEDLMNAIEGAFTHDFVQIYTWFARPDGFEHGFDEMPDDPPDALPYGSENDKEDDCEEDGEEDDEQEGGEQEGEQDGKENSEWDTDEEIERDPADESEEDDDDDTIPINKEMNHMYNFMHCFV